MIAILLKQLVEKKGSDLHLKVGNKPIIRVNGELERLDNEPPLSQEAMINFVKEMVTNKKRQEELDDELSTDFSYSVPGLGRFRVNVSIARGSFVIVIRAIPFEIPSIEELKLPQVLKDISKHQNGIILVTGATGSGKSTTVASMLDYINQNFTKNIISFEEPIEYLHRDKKCIINQKEIPDDVKDYRTALKYVLRQDPDIIFLGELRDQGTIEAAIKASETGHLVISTLHTINASKSISRILDFFPPEKSKSLRFQLAENIRAIVSQRLLKTIDGGKRVVAEVLINTGTMQELISTEEGMRRIPEIVKKSEQLGMQSFDSETLKLYRAGIIDFETAYNASTVKTEIEMARSGITSGTDNLIHG